MIDIPVLMVSWLLTIVGSVFLVSGTVGLIRMPDLYTRLHAVSVADTGGTLVIGLGLLLQAVFIFDNNMAAIKMALILFFTMFTGPAASHVLAKTALLCGHIPTDENGKALLESEQEATQLARSRPADYQHGQDAARIDRQLQALRQQKKGKS